MNLNRKALILGVGPAQKDAIEYLKKAGWYVIGCSYRHEGSGLGLVDRFELVDIIDCEALLHLAKKEKVDLIYSVGSDIAMPVVSQISEKLGLVALVSPQTARLMQNKVMFRDFLCSRDINRLEWQKVTSENMLHGWSIYPAVVKPACSQGQRGVSRVVSRNEALEAAKIAMNHSTDGQAIIEQYLDGREVSANIFLVDGKIMFSIYSNRISVENIPGGIPKCHQIPAFFSDEESWHTDEIIRKAVDALDLKNGPVYIQLKMTSDGPRIIEAAPRLDGCHLWRLIKLATGVDLMDSTFKLLRGMKLDDLQEYAIDTAYHLGFLLKPPGVRFQDNEFEIPGEIEYMEFYYKNGDNVQPVNGYLEKVGYYIQKEEPLAK